MIKLKDKFTKILKLNDFKLSDELVNIFYDRVEYTKNILNNYASLENYFVSEVERNDKF